ncbi:RICIN domain-containing protein [Pseudobacteriovorax antillogorgiicola]|uniref:RICIN domain-containing protein n=1 Tax=Pseudobacteriovorax antillogorgiicola TaxID=1513793 RepID=UPI001F44C9BC|nr:hypothetical protein [Pseudobacteriovorax antillogorgiicola]
MKKFLLTLFTVLPGTTLLGNLKVELSPLTERRVAECGVEQYKEKINHPSCGVDSYKEGTGGACGVKSYKSMRVKACGVALYNEGTGGPCGYINDVQKTCKVKNLGGGCLIPGDEVINRRGKVCRHEDFGVQVYKRCRKAEFGVEEYKTCKSAVFGTNWKSCRLAEFGVDSYNSCKIRKTQYELDVYLASTKPYIEVNAINMARSQQSYLFSAGQKQQLGCLIKRWEDDFLFEDVVLDMKNSFAATFGEEFDPNQFSCNDMNMLPKLSYQGKLCDDYTDSQLSTALAKEGLSSSERFFINACQDKKLYMDYRQWFLDQGTEVQNLLWDVVARADSGYKDKLTKLKESISKHKIDFASNVTIVVRMDGMNGSNPEPKLVNEGRYKIISDLSDKCMNLKISSLDDAAGLRSKQNIHQWGCPVGDSEWTNNFFNLTYTAMGRLEIKSLFSDLCLHNDNGNAVQEYCSMATSYALEKVGSDFLIKDEYGKCAESVSYGDGDNVVFETCNSQKSGQKWKLERMDGESNPGSSVEPILPAGDFSFRSKSSNKCLNLKISNLSDSNGYQEYQPFHQWDCPSTNSEWTNNYLKVRYDNDSFKLESLFSSLCLKDNGSSVVQVNCLDASKLTAVKQGSGYAIKDLVSGRCLRTTGWGNGDKVVFGNCDNDTQTEWTLSPAYN